MHKVIEERLERLREEYQAGQHKLAELDSQRNEVRDTMLRISGAIQALEEIIQTDVAQSGSDAPEPKPAEVADT